VSIRTFKVANIGDFATIDQGFVRPPDFNLVKYWREALIRFEAGLRPACARLRASAVGLARLAELGAFAARAVAGAELERDSAQGWARLNFPFETVEHGARQLLAIGPEVEVLEPDTLRDEIRAQASRINEIHTTKRAQHRG
jgi:predicted DNA-binding transcriptional regulator YafY